MDLEAVCGFSLPVTIRSYTPLVFNMHGFSSSAQSQMESCDFRPIANTEGFLVAHTQETPILRLPHGNNGRDLNDAEEIS